MNSTSHRACEKPSQGGGGKINHATVNTKLVKENGGKAETDGGIHEQIPSKTKGPATLRHTAFYLW